MIFLESKTIMANSSRFAHVKYLQYQLLYMLMEDMKNISSQGSSYA
jgi:hypothetical protein